MMAKTRIEISRNTKMIKIKLSVNFPATNFIANDENQKIIILIKRKYYQF
jgi:hypothetical protein